MRNGFLYQTLHIVWHIIIIHLHKIRNIRSDIGPQCAADNTMNQCSSTTDHDFWTFFVTCRINQGNCVVDVWKPPTIRGWNLSSSPLTTTVSNKDKSKWGRLIIIIVSLTVKIMKQKWQELLLLLATFAKTDWLCECGLHMLKSKENLCVTEDGKTSSTKKQWKLSRQFCIFRKQCYVSLICIFTLWQWLE